MHLLVIATFQQHDFLDALACNHGTLFHFQVRKLRGIKPAQNTSIPTTISFHFYNGIKWIPKLHGELKDFSWMLRTNKRKQNINYRGLKKLIHEISHGKTYVKMEFSYIKIMRLRFYLKFLDLIWKTYISFI